MDDPTMPDLSHLSQEEREIIENVLKRQRDEEAKETQISQKADEELDQIDRQINERKESARRLVGTQDDAICQICQKTKFADGIGHKCFYCQLRSCARCGGRSQSKNKAIWACSLCQKRQQILAKTGKWFQQEVPPKPSSPCGPQPSTSESGTPQPPQIICPPTNDVAGKIANGPQAEGIQQQQPMQQGHQQQMAHQQGQRTAGAVTTNGPGPRRQNTLQRQPTMEEQRQQQHVPQHPQPNGRDKRMENVRTDSRQRMHETDRREDHHGRTRQDENRPLFTVNSTEDNGYHPHQPQSQSLITRDHVESRSSSKTPAPVPLASVPPTPPSSSRPPEFRRTRSIREDDGRRGSIGVRLDNALAGGQPPMTTTASATISTRQKKEKRLHRQLRSMSSSDDEVPSTSEGFAGDEARQRLPNECTSERDLLRYIYSGEKIRNGRKSGMSRPFFGSVEPGGGRPATNSSSSTVPPAVIPGEHLAAKIRTYLSHPVTWQPSADQRRLIGHMVLSRTDGSASGDLGLKVVGGRRSDTGRLGAFITRVKPGSVADTVGRLRPGDEVLEWNGTPLQNATFDQVYEVISASKHESQIELIVSRSAWMPGGDDFLQIQSAVTPIQTHIRHLPNPQFVQDAADMFGATGASPLPHSQSAFLPSPRMAYYQQETESYGARGTIFGRIELALHYSHQDRQLTVMVERAFDLAPRPDGVPRNPYVKIFLLPDRSEYSRRQTAVLAETLTPIWGERFYYNQLSEPALFERALEVTVWDYDKLDSNAFLGEALLDFSAVPLDGQPMMFTLVDMDDENPLRTRLRQRKLSQYTSVPSRIRDEPPRPHSEMAYHGGYRGRAPVPPHSNAPYDGYDVPMRRSRTYDRYGAGAMVPTPTMPEEDWTANQHSGYLSDHAHSQPSRYRHRRPRSATAMRHMTAAEMGASRMYSRAPIDDWEDAATPESARGPPVSHMRDPRSPNGRLLMETMHEQQGYGSDGSETLSIHSQHSLPVRTINRRPQQQQQQQPSLPEPSSGEVDDYIPEETGTSKSAQNMKERKKSLMTRFIPGRAGEAAAKRTGFARSEEVGIPENLSADRLPAMLKQTSKESTDSGDNWMPVLPDGPLGAFVDNLGPGQVVGRQALASPCLGELQVALMGGRGGIEVEIIRAHNLALKPGAKVIPAPYVKAYLMEGKTCVAKAKTPPAKGNTTSPMIRQRLQFNENPRHKMLQLTVLGDNGRMERKMFMGIAQIRLDDLELGAQPVTGMYRLFHSTSLHGTVPVRKDSETSITGGRG